jgi:phospholipid/cholesterol/gamma-HCH transport system substrate-binding protein
VTTAIRKHLRDFIAITVLIVLALVATYIIVQQQRLRIPILESKPFELKAEFSSAQAVVPGQGQTINVAGVEVGQVETVQLENGAAVVTFGIDRQYLPIYKNATVLLRPRTGLQDMFFQLDPGTKSAGVIPNGGTIPLKNTAPDVNLDEILSALDGDTQAYLRLLLIGGGQGLKGQGQNLGKLLGSLGPLNRDLGRLNSMVAQRRHDLADLVHNLGVLTKTIGQHRGDVVSFIRANNAALSAIGAQDPNVQRAVSLLPSTLSTATDTFGKVNGLAHKLGPAFKSLRPFARHLHELNSSVRLLAIQDTPIIKNQIRPFVRSARPDLPPLNQAAKRYSKAAPKLTTLGKQMNRLANMAAYNPHGAQGCPGGQCDPQPPGEPARDEGYLYWLAWLGHNGNSVFANQDANGLYRRIYLSASCRQLENVLLSSALASSVTPIGAVFQTACSQRPLNLP